MLPPLGRGVLVFVLGVPDRNSGVVLKELELPRRRAGQALTLPGGIPLVSTAQDTLDDIVLAGEEIAARTRICEPYWGQTSGSSSQTFWISRAQLRFLTLTK